MPVSRRAVHVPPSTPSPRLVSLLPRKRRQHTPGAFSLPPSSTSLGFFQVLLTSGPAAVTHKHPQLDHSGHPVHSTQDKL